ncbi:DJ-1/PfpI family protein [Suttonella sp. R2A3]|uniref:DJ-1/PfpI family protein n=1 Tax=Suttonella sp. R2A3 TaxID=2908648 RepID=UPI001F162562|nr:DJ-1/PfpI family protein [Suttonella sp. R2A3]UJF24507.1 DJ-1/PfpI family protein [Suttonella sp. R2A3]
MNVAIILFTDFETLDVFGPVEIFGQLSDQYTLTFYSLTGGMISNHHGVSIATKRLDPTNYSADILFIPGGKGTREEVDNSALIKAIKTAAEHSEYVLTVCTGSALLAKTRLLDGKHATTNKKAFHWAVSQGANVQWNKHTRWVVDGKYYTSAGVSAGMDMTLGFISDQYGNSCARAIANHIEYRWIEDKNSDTFKVE